MVQGLLGERYHLRTHWMDFSVNAGKVGEAGAPPTVMHKPEPVPVLALRSCHTDTVDREPVNWSIRTPQDLLARMEVRMPGDHSAEAMRIICTLSVPTHAIQSWSRTNRVPPRPKSWPSLRPWTFLFAKLFSIHGLEFSPSRKRPDNKASNLSRMTLGVKPPSLHMNRSIRTSTRRLKAK
jgi:hypothetical protein